MPLPQVQVACKNGTFLNVRTLEVGDKYGVGNCLVNGLEPMVEFSSLSGYFIAQYFKSTLQSCQEGLMIYSDYPILELSREQLQKALNLPEGNQ